MVQVWQRLKLMYFKSFKEHTRLDLIYGGQRRLARRLLKKERKFRDRSISGNWTAGTD